MSRKPKTPEFSSSYPRAYDLTSPPEAVSTPLVTINQLRKDEGTLIWGECDDLPVSILRAIANSPTATACIGKLEMFTAGSKFSDEGLMSMPINKDGDTLWDLHCQIVSYFVSLDAFSVNFKFNSEGKITNAYNLPVDGCRFMAEVETEEITGLKFNPYFGTSLYRRSYTEEYSLFDAESLNAEIKKKGTKFNGQVYFHGTKRPLYKHYPVPSFWSAQDWIYSDAKMATYVKKVLDNGFFQSVLMKVIGDPNKPSKHPDSAYEETGTDNVKRTKYKYTEGQMFDKMMAQGFSGVEKAAKAMVTWSLNKDQATTIEAFPVNVDFDFVEGILINTMREIAGAMETPGVLINLPDTASPLSGQDSLPNAISFAQANTAPKRNKLENFYNNILLPNLAKKTKVKVKIEQYSPVKVQVSVDDKFWNWMNEAEKIKFIEKNEPAIELVRTPVAEANTAAPQLDQNGKVIEAPAAPVVDEILKNLKVGEINRILSFRDKYQKGTLNLDQATQLLAGFGLTPQQIEAWLNPNPVEV